MDENEYDWVQHLSDLSSDLLDDGDPGYVYVQIAHDCMVEFYKHTWNGDHLATQLELSEMLDRAVNLYKKRLSEV